MTKLTLIDGASPPAKRANKWKLLDDLIRDADYIIIRYKQLIEQQQELLRYVKLTDRGEYAAAPDMSDPALDEEEIETLEKCRAAITLLNPDDNYDEDGNFRKGVISKRLATMIGAYPAGTPSMPEVYAKMLLEHIATDVEIDYIILECACREIERKQKFLPSISEVLKIIGEQKDVWEKRRDAIDCLEVYSRRVADAIGKLKPKIEAALAERVEKEAVFALQFVRGGGVTRRRKKSLRSRKRRRKLRGLSKAIFGGSLKKRRE
jgi:hypothetical protein